MQLLPDVVIGLGRVKVQCGGTLLHVFIVISFFVGWPFNLSFLRAAHSLSCTAEAFLFSALGDSYARIVQYACSVTYLSLSHLSVVTAMSSLTS